MPTNNAPKISPDELRANLRILCQPSVTGDFQTKLCITFAAEMVRAGVTPKRIRNAAAANGHGADVAETIIAKMAIIAENGLVR